MSTFLSVWTIDVDVGAPAPSLAKNYWNDGAKKWRSKWGFSCYETLENAEAAALVAAALTPQYLGKIRIVERKVPADQYPFAIIRRKENIG